MKILGPNHMICPERQKCAILETNREKEKVKRYDIRKSVAACLSVLPSAGKELLGMSSSLFQQHIIIIFYAHCCPTTHLQNTE